MNWWIRGLRRRLFMLILLSCCLARAEKNSKITASLSGIVKGASDATVVVHLESVTDNPTRITSCLTTVLKPRSYAALHC